VGQPATFTSLAIGDGPLQYQWTANGNPIQTAQGANLVLPSAPLEEDGWLFQNHVTDVHGATATSYPATLHVTMALAAMDILGIQGTLPDGPALLPGQALPLVLAATEAAGAVLNTVGRGGGKVTWDNYQLTARIVTVDASGLVSLPADPRVSDGLVPQVQAVVSGRPALTTSLQIPVRYNGHFTADFSGTPGSSGYSGSQGLSGLSGSFGSCDPDSPQAGGNGSNGSDGGPGGDGGIGGPGGAIQAWVTLHPGAGQLLEVKASAQGQSLYFLIDPKGGSLTLNADGGSGGSGGSGGMGGSGGLGGYGCPGGFDGMGGFSGGNGSDGSGGNGGSITVTVDPRAQPFLGALTFSNRGGPGGGVDGPPPVIQAAVVPALW
jgi:hypothetical protein